MTSFPEPEWNFLLLFFRLALHFNDLYMLDARTREWEFVACHYEKLQTKLTRAVVRAKAAILLLLCLSSTVKSDVLFLLSLYLTKAACYNLAKGILSLSFVLCSLKRLGTRKREAGSLPD